MTHTLTTIDGKMHLQAVNPYQKYYPSGLIRNDWRGFAEANPPILWLGPELPEGTVLKGEGVEIKTEIGIGDTWIDNSNGFYSDYYIRRHSYQTRQVATKGGKNMKKWSIKEKELLIAYAFQSDEETVIEQVSHARHMLYLEGNHPEFTKRGLPACVSMFYKMIKLSHEQLNNT